MTLLFLRITEASNLPPTSLEFEVHQEHPKAIVDGFEN